MLWHPTAQSRERKSSLCDGLAMPRSSQLLVAFCRVVLAGSRGSVGRRNLRTEAFRTRARIPGVPLSDFAQSNGDALVLP